MTIGSLAGNPSRTGRMMAVLRLLAVCGCLTTARAGDTLTNASDVLALSAKEAESRVPIRVKGIVTAAASDWHGRFFMQDSSGGVFVENISDLQPIPGDVVEVSGASHPGGYAPCITEPRWKKEGKGRLPEAKPVTIERLMSGTEDSQRVEISGVVRAAWPSGNQLGIELASGGCRLRAYAPLLPEVNPQSLVGAVALLRGTAAAGYNAPLRHIVTVTLFVPQAADFIIEKPAPANPFGEPLTPLKGIAQYRQHRSPANQVHVKGVVTYQRRGEDLFIQDETGGLQIKTRQAEAINPGEVVEAVGFPAVENYLPVLEDAVFRKTAEPRVNLKPQEAAVGELQEGLHHAAYVLLRGRLMDRLVKGIEQGPSVPLIRTTLVLQTTNFVFLAEKDTSEHNRLLASIPIDSLIEVSGICLLESSEDGKITSVRVLLPTSHDVRILQRPGWLTPRHLVVSLAVVLAILILAMSWIVMVSKRNSMLKALVGEKEAAQKELQEAHDQLEDRVKERTAELKVEMTARKESELQFRAVLTERTRLAQELHDVLEQAMSGIAIQLDLVANLFQTKPGNALYHLKLARGLMRTSQADVRDSIWGLRSRAMEQFDLVKAIRIASRQVTNGSEMNVQVETSGEERDLPEIVEENLLRIAQEAVTNAVKHAKAKTVRVELQFTPAAVVLEIKDDGAGFVPEACVGPKDGHFGLLGIRERAERLGGKVEITSAPGAGTCIRVEIPTNPAAEETRTQPVLAKHEERV